MAYQKFLIDNPTCSRRFHLTFDDAQPAKPRVEVRCQYCNIVIFAADHHAPVTLARSENLVKTSALSENLVFECAFEDTLTQRTVPQAAGKNPSVYPDQNPTRK
jgi:hypothetical protein